MEISHGTDLPALAAHLSGLLREIGMRGFDVIAHRIVHGGRRLTESCWLTEKIERQILDVSTLAPLHNPHAVSWIRACRSLFGNTARQAAAFDTAFFATLPLTARLYALPRELAEANGLQRFGFHGLAHQSMLRSWQHANPRARTGGCLITVQLGSGCSIAAIRDGRPIDTSMGFTPVEGLVMATRSGDVDPGLLVHMQRRCGVSVEDLDRILNHQSGLLGLSGRSADMPELLASGDEASALAVEIYCYRARKYIGAYLAAMNGADAILFGGGVGENSPDIRRKILSNLNRLGIVLDEASNRKIIGDHGRISAEGSPIAAHVMPVDEEAILIDDVLGLLERDAVGGKTI